jgi:hypothetical protein
MSFFVGAANHFCADLFRWTFFGAPKVHSSLVQATAEVCFRQSPVGGDDMRSLRTYQVIGRPEDDTILQLRL